MRELGWAMICGAALCGAAQAADTAPANPRSVISAYARRFDNAYVTASKGQRPSRDAPFDADAATPAQERRDAAQLQCERTEFSTARARMECYLDADQAFADAAKLKDRLLVATFIAAIRQAAADADAGKLTPEQLGNVYFQVSQTYATIVHDQFAKWRKTHPAAP